ncbi:MAG: uL30 family ribosomal protein [Candidatus Pacearchaeota archaeon]
MIAVIRIAGRVGISNKDEKILHSLRLRKKYVCILLKDKKILEKIKTKVCFGEIDNETLALLISKRGKKVGGKMIQESASIIAKKLEEGKSLESMGIKPFFCLHPPRGGFKKSTKHLYPKGILGENKNINEILRRMI